MYSYIVPSTCTWYCQVLLWIVDETPLAYYKNPVFKTHRTKQQTSDAFPGKDRAIRISAATTLPETEGGTNRMNRIPEGKKRLGDTTICKPTLAATNC